MDYSGSNQPAGGSSSSGSDDFKYQYKDQGDPGAAPSQAPPPPPPPAKSFNWLACCGISCAVLAVLGLVAGIVLWNIGKGAVDSFQPMIEAAEQVEQTDLAAIKAQAAEVSSFLVAANPEAHTGGWLEMEGLIIPDPDGGSQYPGGQDGTVYFLEGNVLVIDSSNVPQVGLPGDKIRCWGKAVKFDMTAIPLFGGLIEQAMKSDPTVPDMSNLVLFMAKSVELVEGAGDEDDGATDDATSNPCDEPTGRTQDDGWL